MTKKARLQTKSAISKPTISLLRPTILQRTCTCGSVPGLTGECEACSSQRLSSPPKATNLSALTDRSANDHVTTHSQQSLSGYSFGNLAIAPKERLGIQTKLAIGQPGDKYEQEADQVADQVMRMPASEPELQQQSKKPEEDDQKKKRLQMQPLQRQVESSVAEEDEKKKKQLQMKPMSEARSEASPDLQERISGLQQGGGQPLSTSERAFFEPRFGQDFSQVRLHNDAQTADLAQAVNARAFTVGRDVVFGAGQYQPRSTEGQRLLAHELTHVVQQGCQMSRYASTTSDGQVHGPLQRAAIHTGRILDEGSCADLVAGSKWICCDPDKGMERKGKKKDIDSNDCPSEKFTPIFTCEKNCKKALEKRCDDTDNWMALPKSRFANRKCGQDLVICANGNFTHAFVRDKSEREAWEVSKAIPAALGISPDFTGSIYSDENDADFNKDKRCGNKTSPPAKETEEKK